MHSQHINGSSTTTVSTTFTSDDPYNETPSSDLDYIVTHVFFPVHLPNCLNRFGILQNELSLARTLCAAAHAYSAHVCGTSEQAQWRRITKMLDNLQASVQDDGNIIFQLREMRTGGTFTRSM